MVVYKSFVNYCFSKEPKENMYHKTLVFWFGKVKCERKPHKTKWLYILIHTLCIFCKDHATSNKEETSKVCAQMWNKILQVLGMKVW